MVSLCIQGGRVILGRARCGCVHCSAKAEENLRRNRRLALPLFQGLCLGVAPVRSVLSIIMPKDFVVRLRSTILRAALVACFSTGFALGAAAQTVAEGPDHASQVLGNAWDMTGQDDVYPLWWTHNLRAATVANGTMTGTARDTDPHFWLQFPPIPSAISAPNLAQTPIDANRYTHLSFLMWLPDTVVSGASNGRLVWHHGGNTVAAFDAAYSESALFPVYPGWHLYHFDLAALPPRVGLPWNGTMYGLRIDPCVGCNVQFQIDWARLYHPNEAPAISLPSGKTHWLTEIKPTGSSQTVSTVLPVGSQPGAVASLPPGSYRVAAISDGDYALSQRGKAWTFDTQNDVLWSSNYGLSGASTGSNGLRATTNNSDPCLQLDIPQQQPIDASKYRYLTIDMSLDRVPPNESGLLVWWGDQAAAVRHPSDFIPVQAGRATYQIDLQRYLQWAGLVRALRIDPLNGPAADQGVGFTLHSVRLTTTAGLKETVVYNSTPLTINARPSVKILSPSPEEGEDYALVEQGKAWTMQPGQVKRPELSNLSGWEYINRIPDLEQSGSFFHATSQPASPGQTEGDPHVFLAFQENTYPIDATNYRWLGFDLYVPMDATAQSELTRGAMMRLAWKANDADPGVTSDDVILLPGLQRYWFDMSQLVYEPASARTWGDMVRYLRIDPLEFPESRHFYVGPVQLRSTPSARHVLPVKLQLTDADGDALNVKVMSGHTVLAQADGLAAGQTHQIIASLAALPAGEHPISVEVSDGRSSIQRTAMVPVRKLNLQAPVPTAQMRSADRVFAWAEQLLGGTLGAGTPSGQGHACLQGIPGAYGRSYAASGICLFTLDGLVLYTLHGGDVVLAGSLSSLLTQAAAAGF